MAEGHHTPEQVDMAFAHAPTVLRRLVEAGVESPRFELFADGSGCLYFGGPVTAEQYRLAVEQVRSARPSMRGENGIVFCCGLVTAAEDARDNRGPWARTVGKREQEPTPIPEHEDPEIMWTLESALDVARRLNEFTVPVNWDTAMGGGVLHRGHSTHDLDLVLVPRYGALMVDLYDVLIEFGATRVRDAKQLRARWVKPDTKHVEEWSLGGRRIDVIVHPISGC